MNKLIVICGVLSSFTLHFIPTTNAYAGENDEIKAPHRIPSPPPPPPAPCPPIPPGVEMEQTCETPTLDELRAKYLETEGPNNRGRNFYYYAGAFFGKHKFYKITAPNQANYSFNTQTMFETLGPPDYQKSLMRDNQTMEVYAYVFNNKSNRDYVMVVYTVNGLIYRSGYSETSLKIDESWEKFK
jgi:hypothetical protein